MDHITLTHTDLTVSRACFGTMTFGSQTDETAARRIIDRSIDAGINFFDTANIYNRGVSEEIFGRILKGRRARFIVASKVRGKMGDAPDESGLSATAIRKAIDDSLRRLQTDYLDIYYMHMPDPAVPIEESLEAMNALVREGKVRWIAQSNYASWQVAEMLWLAEKRGWQAPWISQPMYNLLARGIEQEFVPFCDKFGVSNIVYNPLAGGMLTGKQPRDAPIEGTRFHNNKLYLDRYWHPDFFAAVDEIRGISQRAGRSMISVAINWLLHHTSTASIILGASRLEQLEQTLGVFDDGPLAADTLDALNQVWQKLRGVTPRYNR